MINIENLEGKCDFYSCNYRYNKKTKEVESGEFMCLHCGKEKLKPDELQGHFEKCFKDKTMKEYPEKNTVEVIDIELEGIAFEDHCEFLAVPKFGEKKEDGSVEEVKAPNFSWSPVSLNVGDKNIGHTIEKWMDKHNGANDVVFKIGTNKKGKRTIFFAVEEIDK